MACNGDLKWKTDNAIDEAYRRGYKDGKNAANAIADQKCDTCEHFRYSCVGSITLNGCEKYQERNLCKVCTYFKPKKEEDNG